eukprot:TRINITY_DN2392_c0_g1_i1.p1 TRINITY_DN2392_c0_g1~~TRINITY_DN2392_c0_g1_i1.p1  ORF type:complete len:607 (-),score=143.98 TRINITY_DN2392_c0_g1_i1:173-1993(-)
MHRLLSLSRGGANLTRNCIAKSATSSSASFASTKRSFTDGAGVKYDAPDYLQPLIVDKDGIDLIHDPLYNKGTGYPIPERDRLRIRGLVPPRTFTLQEQVERVLARYHEINDDVQKYVYISSLQDRNETLFYRLLMENISQMASIIYTPTVGEACQKFGTMFRRARGMYFSSLDKGEMISMVYNWPSDEVDIIVVTDGSRILGLGDLGVHGMGIPIGKLALYVAGAGIHPNRVLPVTIDVGTDNQALLQDKFYLGNRHSRLKGPEYYQIIDEFLHAVYTRWPNVLVQFEDFNNEHALPLLEKYRNKYLCFNDDIQGTGAVALAGILCALRAQSLPPNALTKQRVVCLGAGSAGLGVCNSLVMGMVQEGLTAEEAYKNFWLVDKDGLLGLGRKSITPSQLPYCRLDEKNGSSLLETIRKVKPTILLGLSGVGATFTEPVIREMAKHCPRPIIFPLSNPTSKAECTAEQAYRWTDGNAIVASGSPFKPVIYNGKTLTPTQGNNMYIFPGLGLGVIASKSKRITDSMFYAAAKTLAAWVPDEDVLQGKVYPGISRIRDVSLKIAVAVCNVALEEGLAGMPKNIPNLEQYVASFMYVPEYASLVRSKPPS